MRDYDGGNTARKVGRLRQRCLCDSLNWACLHWACLHWACLHWACFNIACFNWGIEFSSPALMAAEVRHPWSTNTHPSDTRQRHVEQVEASHHQYHIYHAGTMDGENCRSPVGTFEGWQQSWESNRYVRLENMGPIDIVNPWLSNGRNRFRTAEEIVQTAIEPGMTDREKALAIWHQETMHRFHFSTWDQEDNNPVKVFNCYGYNTCGDDSMCLAGLWRRAGLTVRPARIMGHCVSQVFYGGRWHLLDGDMATIYLLRDNETIASERDLVRDHDLIKRSRTHGVLSPDNRKTSEWEASLYVYEGDSDATRDMLGDHTMDMVLRPNESLTWRWGHLIPVKYHGTSLSKYPDTICNGSWEYAPDLSDSSWRDGTESVEGVQLKNGGITAEKDAIGTIIWKMHSPYPFVGGQIEIQGSHGEWACSWDGRQWSATSVDLDPLFPRDGPARYEYYLRCQFSGRDMIRKIRINNDLQMAPLGLPAALLGNNTFTYTDDSPESPGQRAVRITHEWVERSLSQPPAPPKQAFYPVDDSRTQGTEITFRWAPAIDPDGHEVVDYHFQLSDRPDMKWPLSTNFDKLVSRTADRGRSQYTVPQAGLLNSHTTYYWRVRAQDSQGVWGDWSETWHFTPIAPGHPLEVRIDYDREQEVAVLRWVANPDGESPQRYLVFGSDEKGFSAHDQPYLRYAGNQEGDALVKMPSNFVAETRNTELVVIGRHLSKPNTNAAFYRVVAVDGRGARSGPSDYAEGPRPFIYTSPSRFATVGQEYRYTAASIRSEGDLRCRIVEGELTMNFWDAEQPRYSLERGPGWLKMDPSRGILRGTAREAGTYEVVISVSIDRPVRNLDETRLSWGQQLVLGIETKHVGTSHQRFVLTVPP